jgi:hypothetical protein
VQDRKLQVQIDKWASPDEVQAVEETFRRVGLEASVRAGVIELSEQFTWIVIISVPVSTFLSGYFAAAGADAWSATKTLSDRLRQFVRDLKHDRGDNQDGRIELEDAGRAWLLLSSSLPEEAFRQLDAIDWSVVQSGSLRWNNQDQCWMHYVYGKDPQQASKPQH